MLLRIYSDSFYELIRRILCRYEYNVNVVRKAIKSEKLKK